MIFPFRTSRRSAERLETGGRIDRQVADRSRRLTIGLNLTDDLGKVDGVLIVTGGRGKYLRLYHSVHTQTQLPPSLTEGLQSLDDANETNLNDLPELLIDLAQYQAACVASLKQQAGKYVDRVLAISVTDPGIWTSGFDGRRGYLTCCHAAKLAELTGITVIDSFPERDLLVDGHGRQLQALPNWLNFSDRNSKVANQTRVLIDMDQESNIFFLPPSDGLDSEIPNIGFAAAPGGRFLHHLCQALVASSKSITIPSITRLIADGVSDETLISEWNAINSFDSDPPFNRNSGESKLIDAAVKRYHAGDISVSSIIKSAADWIVRLIQQRITKLKKQNLAYASAINEKQAAIAAGPLGQIILAVDQPLEAGIHNLLRQRMEAVEFVTVDEHSIPEKGLHATNAALLGLLHTDQMPANLPSITGAGSQRILGRLTPGQPSNYRQLLISMADFCPPAMKLRDAV